MASDGSSFTAEDCSICLSVKDYGMKGITSLPCGHRYHYNCICIWFREGKTSCPVCRVDFSEKNETVFKLGKFRVEVDPSQLPKNHTMRLRLRSTRRHEDPVTPSPRRVARRLFPPAENDGTSTPSRRRVARRLVSPEVNDGTPTPSPRRVARGLVSPEPGNEWTPASIERRREGVAGGLVSPEPGNDDRHALTMQRLRQQVAVTCSSIERLRNYLTRRFFPEENGTTPTSIETRRLFPEENVIPAFAEALQCLGSNHERNGIPAHQPTELCIACNRPMPPDERITLSCHHTYHPTCAALLISPDRSMELIMNLAAFVPDCGNCCFNTSEYDRILIELYSCEQLMEL